MLEWQELAKLLAGSMGIYNRPSFPYKLTVSWCQGDPHIFHAEISTITRA